MTVLIILQIPKPAQYLLLFLTLLLTQPARAQQQTRLNTGWEFVRQVLGGVWEAVRPDNPIPT